MRARLDDPDDQSPRAVGRRVRRAASGSGPVPSDPDEREAAHELALDHLQVLDRQRYWAPAMFVVLAVLAAGPVWLAAAVGHSYLRRRVRARVTLLAPGAPRLD